MIQKPLKNEAKTVPRGLQNSRGPRFWCVLAAKRPQEASKTAQEASKRPPRRPKMAQDAPKTVQDGPSWLQKWNQNRRKIDGEINRKYGASWNRFLEGFSLIFRGKLIQNRKKNCLQSIVKSVKASQVKGGFSMYSLIIRRGEPYPRLAGEPPHHFSDVF